MDEDLSLKWELANPLTIQIDEKRDSWHSGAARDVASLDQDRVLVATDTGGLWIAQRDGTAIPIGDVDQPDFWCVTAGSYGGDHFYAGGFRLYESDVSNPVPLLHWREISVTWFSTGPGGTPKAHTADVIYRIIVLREDKRIVLATSHGVFWADIPPPPERLGCLAILLGAAKKPPAVYKWNKAVGLENTKLGFLGLAAGPPRQGEINRSIAVASWGWKEGDTLQPMQFYRGEWEGGTLVMKKATMRKVAGIDRNNARTTTMASCDADANFMYAVSSNETGFVEMMWKSTDAGQSWDPFVPNLVKPAEKSFAMAAGNQGEGPGRPNNCIAVSRKTPDTVIVGWRFPGFFLSEDGGLTWERTDTESSPDVHSDVHAVYFDPTDPIGETIILASDGGISMLPELGDEPNLIESKYNRQLATLQFQSSPSRMFFGGGAANRVHKGVMIGGLQDNGSVTCSIDPAVESWVQFGGGGDGFQSTFMHHGQALFDDNEETLPQIGIVRHAFWRVSPKGLFNLEPIPVLKDDPQMPYPAGIPYWVTENRDLHAVVFSPVPKSGWTNREGERMYAVAGKRSSIYGLFYREMGTKPHWEFIARFPLNDGVLGDDDRNRKNWEPWAITSVASLDGEVIYVGTNGGRLIVFETRNRIATEISVSLRRHPDGDKGSEVNRIAVVHDQLAFASYNLRGSRQGYVLRIRPPKAVEMKALPVELYYGLEVAHEREDIALYAATDSNVYVSRDPADLLGNAWKRASRGLPRRPHCGDLSYVSHDDGERWLYMSTYGRSFWRARR